MEILSNEIIECAEIQVFVIIYFLLKQKLNFFHNYMN